MADDKGRGSEENRLVVWAEKYRPARLSEVINQTHATDRIRAFVADRNIPHMLLAGPAGVGKTTTALAIASELYGKDWRGNTLELNASNERGIDVIRNKVKDFARTKTMSPVGYRLIILDEADALTQEAQQALRRTMETYSSVSRFILICNWSSRIIEPIQSRCAVFRFHTLGEDDQMKFLNRIAKEEDLKIEDDAKDAIIYLAEGDLRKIANIVQSCAAQKRKSAITEQAVFDVVSQARPEDVRKMLDLAICGDFAEARKRLTDMLLRQGLSGEDIIREMHKQVFNLDVSEQAKVALIEKTGEYEYRLSQGGTDMIQLESLLAQFMMLCKK
jgi:replication factor C small subunit